MSITTQALVSRQVGSSLEFENIVLDSLRPDEVLVEIHATGICHTDFACMNGTLPAAFPSVFGHEGSLNNQTSHFYDGPLIFNRGRCDPGRGKGHKTSQCARQSPVKL